MKLMDELEHRLDPLSVKEAAKIYGDSTGTFYKKIRRGEVSGVFREEGKPRGRIKICPKEFVAWLRQKIAVGCQASKIPAQPPSNGQPLAIGSHKRDLNNSESAGGTAGKEE